MIVTLTPKVMSQNLFLMHLFTKKNLLANFFPPHPNQPKMNNTRHPSQISVHMYDHMVRGNKKEWKMGGS